MNASFQVHIQKATSPLVIDGEMNEAAWQQAEVATNFFMVQPMDTSYAKVRTDVRMTYDAQNLYIIAVCYKYGTGPYMVESMRRDFDFQKNDNFIVFIDPFEDQTTGFSFGANAVGAQWDGTMYEGGKVDLNWDNKWNSSVKNYKDKYIFEAAIPFKTIRYKKGATEWGINFSRNDLKTTEKSSWAPMPRQFPTASLAYTGTLVWDAPPPEPKSNISIIPYVLAHTSKDYTTKYSSGIKATEGVDAKISLSSALNLDLTIHPDFSQVEVDNEVTNLSRFELFFPEKRQFFLENGDLFGNFGYMDIRPFFSRRIGLGVPINAGIRLSGKLGKKTRIGILDMETASQNSTALPAQNFIVISMQQKIFKRSNIAFIYVDKTSINYHPSAADTSNAVYSKYNRNIGAEYNLASSNNLWTGKALVMKSFSPNESKDEWVQAANLQYSSRKWLIYGQYQYVGKNYNAEVGYVPRRGYIKLNPQITYYFFPKFGSILSHGPQLISTYYFDEHLNETDHTNMLSYLFTFRNKSTLGLATQNDYVELRQPFDPTNTGKDSLSTASKHNWNTVGFDFISKPQHLFTYDASLRYGGYYAHGQLLSIRGDLGYRFQPYVKITVAASYNHLSLPQPWGIKNFLLIGPKIDITFTNTLFFSTFIQYNEQQQNININTRFQWRYKPASDLFIVYTDNYLPAPFSAKSREFVIKFTYWWNL